MTKKTANTTIPIVECVEKLIVEPTEKYKSD